MSKNSSGERAENHRPQPIQMTSSSGFINVFLHLQITQMLWLKSLNHIKAPPPPNVLYWRNLPDLWRRKKKHVRNIDAQSSHANIKKNHNQVHRNSLICHVMIPLTLLLHVRKLILYRKKPCPPDPIFQGSVICLFFLPQA